MGFARSGGARILLSTYILQRGIEHIPATPCGRPFQWGIRQQNTRPTMPASRTDFSQIHFTFHSGSGLQVNRSCGRSSVISRGSARSKEYVEPLALLRPRLPERTMRVVEMEEAGCATAQAIGTERETGRVIRPVGLRRTPLTASGSSVSPFRLLLPPLRSARVSAPEHPSSARSDGSPRRTAILGGDGPAAVIGCPWASPSRMIV